MFPSLFSLACRGPYAFAATDFKGYACAQAWCPKGDNPKTYGGDRMCFLSLIPTLIWFCSSYWFAVNEIQQLSCRADNGTFMLSFRENVTLPIYWNSTLVEFKHSLEQIFTYVHITFAITTAFSLNHDALFSHSIGAVEVTLAGATLDQRFNGHVCSVSGRNG